MNEPKPKAYCTCIAPKSFAPLWDSTKEEWSDIFVCSACRKPSHGVWLSHVAPCENCFKDFSFPETLYAPWGPVSVLEDPSEHDGEYLCARCAREPESGLQRPYRGWKWAGKQAPDWQIPYIGNGHSVELEEIREKPLDSLVDTL